MKITPPPIFEDLDDEKMFEMVEGAITDIMKSEGIQHVIPSEVLVTTGYVSTLLRTRIKRGPEKNWVKTQKIAQKLFNQKLEMAEKLATLMKELKS